MARKDIGDAVARPIRDAVARMAFVSSESEMPEHDPHVVTPEDSREIGIDNQSRVSWPPRVWRWLHGRRFDDLQFNTLGLDEPFGLRTIKFEMAELLFGPFPRDVQMKILKRLSVGDPGGMPQALEAELLALAAWQLGNLVDAQTGKPPNILTLTGSQIALLLKYCCLLGRAIAVGVGIIVTVATDNGPRSGAVMGIGCENGKCVFTVRLVPGDHGGQDFVDCNMSLVLSDTRSAGGGVVIGEMRHASGGDAEPVSVTGGMIEW